jgi:K(+)-stimulated pyrophosphate-energized sodium pump
MAKNGQQQLTRILSVVFFIISMVFVYRSFYGMRIGKTATE